MNMKRSKSLARVHHEGKARRRRRRQHAERYERNPGIPVAVWVVGGLAVAAGGYFAWRYMQQRITVVDGGAYGVPAGSITVTFPASTTAQIIMSGGTTAGTSTTIPAVVAGSATAGQNPLSFTAAAGNSYTAGWTDSAGNLGSATITAS
jgi:hypothetical protein